MTSNYAFIGMDAGITGLCVSNKLRQLYPKAQIMIVEKERKAELQSSGQNSDVQHTGIYYPEGNIKTQVCVNRAKRLKPWVIQNKLWINSCGKIIVTQNKEIEPQMGIVASGAKSNAVIFSLNDAKKIRKREPGIHPNISINIWSPDTFVISPKEVIETMNMELTENGIRITTNTKIQEIKSEEANTNLNDEHIRYGHIFNYTGLDTEAISHKYSVGEKCKILPFKGLYWNLKEVSAFNTPFELYPVPDLNIPLLRIHFTPNTDSKPQFNVGSTLKYSLKRENYRWLQNIKPQTTLLTISRQYIMNRNNFRKYVHQQARLLLRSFLQEATRKLTSIIQERAPSISSKAGIRSQSCNLKSASLEKDFTCIQKENRTNVLNAISPAFTASFELAELNIKESGY